MDLYLNSVLRFMVSFLPWEIRLGSCSRAVRMPITSSQYRSYKHDIFRHCWLTKDTTPTLSSPMWKVREPTPLSHSKVIALFNMTTTRISTLNTTKSSAPGDSSSTTAAFSLDSTNSLLDYIIMLSDALDN